MAKKKLSVGRTPKTNGKRPAKPAAPRGAWVHPPKGNAGFDPDAAAMVDSGIFGLPTTREQASIILTPVPFDATTSYRRGTALGPGAILEASKQVDLYDHHFGHVYAAGIAMDPEPRGLVQLSARTRALAEPIIAKGGAEEGDADAIRQIDAAGEHVAHLTYNAFAATLGDGKLPGLVGGDHSTPLGAIRACADFAAGKGRPKGGLGILHLDAHMDLRVAFEGFTWSHASVMYNVLERIPGVTKLVQIGIRDYSAGELDYARRSGKRVAVHFDADWAAAVAAGARWTSLVAKAMHDLPEQVYVSFDIDALEPALCPHTGTPVPGGLRFNEAAMILKALAETGRRVVGFDLVETAPGPEGEPELDANVASRVLYKLCGCAAASQR